MASRHKAREVAMQLLYYLDSVEGEPVAEVARFWGLHPEAVGVAPYVEKLVHKVLGAAPEIERAISDASEKWSFHRMDAVSRCILRIGACELMYYADVPPKVVIDEAVELAKEYGPATSDKFVNAILDRLLRERAPA
ncbi:MAG: transcription antitermination factor NusB [bacterium]|nr:transcription antitermination factor NusB [bacterium]